MLYDGKKLHSQQCCQEAPFVFCISLLRLLRNSYSTTLLYIKLPCGGRWVPNDGHFSNPAKILEKGRPT